MTIAEKIGLVVDLSIERKLRAIGILTPALGMAVAGSVAAPENQRGDPGTPGRDGTDGKDGKDGKDGMPGLVWRGRWSAKTSYQKGDATFFAGSSWIATKPSLGQIPGAHGKPWDLLAAAGSAGADGLDGAGGPGGAVYVHNQGAPAATWTINHNLGFRPSIELIDAGGAEFEAEVIHTSVNQAVVSLALAIAGTARCT